MYDQIKQKEKELNELKIKLKKISENLGIPKEIYFKSIDSVINYKIICIDNDIFSEIKE